MTHDDQQKAIDTLIGQKLYDITLLDDIFQLEKALGLHRGPQLMEQHPDGVDYWNKLTETIRRSGDDRVNVCATAAQRVEAILRLYNLWQ
jgi:hypothetical protein